MKTQAIKDLVGKVLNHLKRNHSWDEDIICQVSITIDHKFRYEYDELVNNHGQDTVNRWIGRYAREITGLRNTGKRRKANGLIKTYTVLKP